MTCWYIGTLTHRHTDRLEYLAPDVELKHLKTSEVKQALHAKQCYNLWQQWIVSYECYLGLFFWSIIR